MLISSSLRRRGRRSSPHRRAFLSQENNPPRSRRLLFEVLEGRLLLAFVRWDGGPSGTGTNWQDSVNWAGDALPASSDDAVIGPAFSGVTITSASGVNVCSLSSQASLQITAGTFSVADASTVAGTLTLSGGTLSLGGAGSMETPSGGFVWTGGTLSGSGVFGIGAGATLDISGASAKYLSGATIDLSGTATSELPTHPLCLCERFMGLNGQLKAEAGTRKFGVQGVKLGAQRLNGSGAVRR